MNVGLASQPTLSGLVQGFDSLYSAYCVDNKKKTSKYEKQARMAAFESFQHGSGFTMRKVDSTKDVLNSIVNGGTLHKLPHVTRSAFFG